MSSEWSIKSFGDLMDQGVLEIGDGYRAKNDELGGSGLMFLRAGHVRDTHIDFDGADRFLRTDDSRFGRKIAQPGDVVITTKGNSTGRIAYVTNSMSAFVYSSPELLAIECAGGCASRISSRLGEVPGVL